MATTEYRYWTAYKSRPKLLDVTMTACAAGQVDYELPTSGSTTGANAASVNGGIKSTVPAGRVADALLAVVTSPIATATSFPDCKIWFSNGNTDLSRYQVFDVGYPVNMLPDLEHVEWNPEAAQALILLGLSARDALRAVKGGAQIPNLPTLITGYKIPQDGTLTCHVASLAGWSSPIVPLRVRVYGDILSEADIQEFAGMRYPGAIRLAVPPAPVFTSAHAWPGLGTLDGWGGGPGGTAQTQTPCAVNRRVCYGYNAIAASAGGPFVFSDKNGVDGNAGNVSAANTGDTRTVHDLGETLVGSKSAVFIDRVGFNLYTAGDSALVAWQVDGAVVPAESQNGKTVSASVNDLAYGHDTTCGGNGSKTRTLASTDALARVLMYRNAVVPIAQPVTGSIAAGDMSFAYSGVKLEVA